MYLKILFVNLLLMGIHWHIAAHPLNMTVTDISYKDHKIHMHMKFFVDDLQGSLSQFTKGPVDLVNELPSQRDPTIKRYISRHFALSVNGAFVKWTFKKAHIVTDVMYVEYEAAWNDPTKIKSLKVKDVLLFDDVPEQRNIVNIHFNGNQSVLLFENKEKNQEQELSF